MKYETQNTGIENIRYNYMPIGTVVSYAGATTPIGWLLCDGRTIEEHEYPDLYRVLGSGILPDLRGEFVRGLDNGRGLDGGRVLGSEQGDAIRNITGTITPTADIDNMAICMHKDTTGALQSIGAGRSAKIDSTPVQSLSQGISFDASLVVPTAEENRPKNVALNYIIKAFNTTTDTETLPIQMAKALNNKIENNYNDQLDATVDIVGKEFYDYIQNSGEKTAGKIYRDRLQKGIFRCLKTTTSVLNTSEFYESVSNNDLLKGKVLHFAYNINPSTPAFTVHSVALNIPSGYRISGITAVGRVLTDDIGQVDYNTIDTPISYSYNSNNVFKYALLVDSGGRGRGVDVMVSLVRL